MMWIPPVPEDEATGEVAEAYRRTKRAWGGIDHVVLAHSRHQASMRSLMSFYLGLMHGDCELELRQREMIAVTVSQLNDCGY
jgi:alkylhydroperoxidase family enzyme